MKTQIIKQIKNIISEYGSFSTGEVGASYSPSVVNQKGNLVHLIEYFDEDTVDVEVYDDEVNIDSYSLPYKELDVENLEYILELCQSYKELQEEF